MRAQFHLHQKTRQPRALSSTGKRRSAAAPKMREGCCRYGIALARAQGQAHVVRMTIEELNAARREDFIGALGAIYEESPWIAEMAYARRPFADAVALRDALARVVAQSGEAAQLALVRAHPDLAGRLARAGALGAASAAEQSGLGLDRLSDEAFEEFAALNTAYRARFGFPFVIAVKRHTRQSVLAAFRARLAQDAAQELRTALAEIDAIAQFRLDALLAG
jgi:2-oxo-4-hydroxy-4-carboxy-5-ureidoimidazoline decarboxylase